MFVLAHQSFFYFFGNSRVHTQVFVIGYAGAVNLIRAETILLDGIFVGKTFGTGQLIHTAIGTWIHYIMLYVDGFPFSVRIKVMVWSPFWKSGASSF